MVARHKDLLVLELVLLADRLLHRGQFNTCQVPDYVIDDPGPLAVELIVHKVVEVTPVDVGLRLFLVESSVISLLISFWQKGVLVGHCGVHARVHIIVLGLAVRPRLVCATHPALALLVIRASSREHTRAHSAPPDRSPSLKLERIVHARDLGAILPSNLQLFLQQIIIEELLSLPLLFVGKCFQYLCVSIREDLEEDIILTLVQCK